MKYLNWNQQTITDFSPENISALYDRGYVFTRLGKGVMNQTRSVRVDLSRFELSSENRRILKKIPDLNIAKKDLPLADYDFRLAKLAKEFYDQKFGPGIMSANKAKEMLAGAESNFNALLIFSINEKPLGYSISHENAEMLHYSYPFYDLADSPKDIGLCMMTLAVQYARGNGLKHIYLGSLQRPSDTYKLQFKGLEWYDGGPEGSGEWSDDLDRAKTILRP